MTFVAMGTAAAIGAGTSALTGGDEDDILKAAILGGITGGVTGGMTSGAEGLNPELLNASPELLNAAPEVMTAAAPEGILQAQPLQLANAPTVTSDVGQFTSDKAILDQQEIFRKAQNVTPPAEGIANLKVPPAGVEPTGYGINVPPQTPPTNAVIPETTFNKNLSYSTQVQSPYNTTSFPQPNLAQGMPSVPTFEEPQSSLGKGFEKALGYMERNPFMTMSLGYTALNKFGAFDPESAQMPDKKYKGSLSNYRMSPNFQPSRATPNVYTPRYAAQGGIMMAAGGTYDDEPMGDDNGYAQGGIASYARGRKVSSQDELNAYMKMMEGEATSSAPAPDYVGSVGIMRDEDPDTKYKDALTASMIRMGKVNSRANYSPYQNMKRPNAMGGINLSAPGIKAAEKEKDNDYASGGITQADRYNMGGYASGSVPRLLKGPGDGMSDDIPASIDNRQPARLADGEFVIPADVVSHLGNGSTEAGAKKLHKMMTDLRKDRTGNPKQGKQIVAEKYLPKKSRKA